MGGSGGPPGGSDDSDSEEDPDPQGHGRDPATPPRPRNPLAAADPFAPGDQCIPGRESPRILAPLDCEPWAVARLNHVAIMTMSIDVLFPFLPTQPGWMFPHLNPENRPPPADVGWRLGLLIQAYRDFETSALMFYWESTHSFPIPDSAVRRDPWLGVYHKERNNRRSHAGRRWKAILELLIIAMREGWSGLDILLDPFFLHFPKRVETVTWYPGVDSRQANLSDPNLHRPEPTDLLEALDECNAEDPRQTRLDPRYTYGIRAGSGWTWDPLPDLSHIPLHLFSSISSYTYHAIPNPPICNHLADPSPHLRMSNSPWWIPLPLLFMGLHYTEAVTICASSQNFM
ncbi:unnamed protein product [Phytophthora fragariaefolia]|uniref:Unnamed protein product n=1 Tax=Phytophthora fragariaefolia TaxID=1490495 RepID=A0A9W7CSX4_9STRA|nr:unnamed protein product [Phytophthora fragariaefolia]